MDTWLIFGGAIAVAAVVLFALPRSKDGAAEPGTKRAPPETPTRVPGLVSAEDFERDALAVWLAGQASKQTGIDLRTDPMALTRLYEAAKAARAGIESSGKAEVSLPYLSADASGPKHFTLTVTRDQLAGLRGKMID